MLVTEPETQEPWDEVGEGCRLVTRAGGGEQRMTTRAVFRYGEFMIPTEYMKPKIACKVKAKDKNWALIIVPLTDKTMVVMRFPKQSVYREK